ncbi:MAG: endonuclease/exonuclease/phosphatase family protein [Tepidisphaeraceae bacterium]
MRIVSYNILDGGEGRADPLAEVIEAQRPDVVALVEATDLTVIERIAKRLSMDFVHAPGRKQASALLSRWIIRDSINHALLHKQLSRSLLEATVVDRSGSEWVFGVVHLHAHAAEKDEQEREGETAVVRNLFAPHRAAGRAHMIVGDFNAISPVQQIDPEKCKPSTRKAWADNGGYLPRRVIQSMLADGYVDTLHALHPDQAATSGTFSTQFPGQRVDFIFTHSIDPSRLQAAWIEYDRLAKYASDHFPVAVEIA